MLILQISVIWFGILYLLTEYFSKHLGPFADVFGGLEKLSAAVSQALLQCSQVIGIRFILPYLLMLLILYFVWADAVQCQNY